MSDTSKATIETLTAEVRVLMVGNRQITLSVYRQLDMIGSDAIRPFGRVRTSKSESTDIELVGVDQQGNLVRAVSQRPDPYFYASDLPIDVQHHVFHTANFRTLSGIVEIARTTKGRRLLMMPNEARRLRGCSRPGLCDRSVLEKSYNAWMGGECDEFDEQKDEHEAFATLPLIVLAGLR